MKTTYTLKGRKEGKSMVKPCKHLKDTFHVGNLPCEKCKTEDLEQQLSSAQDTINFKEKYIGGLHKKIKELESRLTSSIGRNSEHNKLIDRLCDALLEAADVIESKLKVGDRYSDAEKYRVLVAEIKGK